LGNGDIFVRGVRLFPKLSEAAESKYAVYSEWGYCKCLYKLFIELHLVLTASRNRQPHRSFTDLICNLYALPPFLSLKVASLW